MTSTTSTNQAELGLELETAEAELGAVHAYVTNQYKNAVMYRSSDTATQLARTLFFMEHGSPDTEATIYEFENFENHLLAETETEITAERAANEIKVPSSRRY